MASRGLWHLFVVAPLLSCNVDKPNPLYSNLPVSPAPLGSIKQMALTRIPFPPGQWVQLGETKYSIQFNNFASDKYKFATTTWGLIEREKISVFLEVLTNEDKSFNGRGFINPAWCRIAPEQKLVFLQETKGITYDDGECLSVRYFRLVQPPAGSSKTDAWNAAKQYGGIPPDAIRVFISKDTYGNVMEYSLYFFPDRDEAPIGNWAAGVESDEQKAYVRSLVQWAQGFRHWVVEGTQNTIQAPHT